MPADVSLHPEELLVTDRLYRRQARRANLQKELEAYRELSTLMTVDPGAAIQRFLDLALELCPAAGSAGLSELASDDAGQPVFRWTAMSGAFASYVGGTTPRDFSPCGLCLDAHHTILVERPARVFTYFNEAEPEIVEGLVVPLYDTGKRPVGTLWVTSHDEHRKFDPTDARVMEQLAVQLVLAMKLRKKAWLMVELEEASRDKDILVKEVRHRVKNMIQMTSALLHLQERGLQSSEAKTALREAQTRLLVLSNVYESLLDPAADSREVDVAGVIEGLAHALHQTSPATANISIRTECEPLLAGVTTAVPIGLIVNEAVTNALKHGFAIGQSGEIAISLKRSAGACCLTISDNGRGFANAVREGSLGVRLMRNLVRQLGGRLAMDGSNGATVHVEWAVEGGVQHDAELELAAS